MDQRALWSPDGRYVAFRTSFGGTHRFRTPHGLGIVAATGGPPSDAGRAFDGGFLDGPYAYAWDPDGAAVFFTGAAPEGTAIFALAVPDGTLERFTPGPGKWALLSIAPAADRMAFVGSDPATPWEVHVSPVSRYVPRRLTRSNPHLDRRVLPDMEVVRWESDGLELAGVLIRPPRAVAPYPLVTYLHGGPEGQAMMAFAPELPSPVFDAGFAIHDPQALAARGYAVFIPNFRGSGGRGTALREAALGDWTRIYVADIDAGVASLVRAGIADSARLGLVGSRSGATKVVGLLARATRFRAASILDGHVDLALEYRSSEDFRDYWRQLLGGEPTDPAVAARHSPITAVAAIATPLQIIGIEGAWETPSEQALTLHAALLERRVPGELILTRAPRLGDRIELARRVVAWFDRWLARP
jgi:dipeptidyl aminopeptidase/acylaminoacyl peptidase